MTTVLDALTACWAWVLAHPAYAWPLVSALVTIALKPRTPEQYAAMAAMRPTWFWSRFAPLLQLVGALGLDPVKALAVLSKVFTGKQDSSGRPPMGGLVVFVGALAVAVAVSACAAFQSAEPFLPKPNDVACVANDVERGVSDPFTIIADCPGLAQTAIADVEKLIVDLFAAKRAAHRAAAEHAAETCDGGVPVRTLNFANDNDAGRSDAGK